MGFTSAMMVHFSDIDAIIIAMSSDPFYPHDGLREIHCNNEPVVIAFDIEYDPLACDNTRRRIEPSHIRHARPPRFAHLREPSVDRSLQRCVILVSRATVDELTQCTPGNDPHFCGK